MSTTATMNDSSMISSTMSTSEMFTLDLDTSPMSNVSSSGPRWVSDTEALIMSVFLNIIAILGIVGNTVVVIAVVFSTKLQTATNVFVIALAVTDLLVCVTLPFQTMALLSSSKESLLIDPTLCAAIGGITSVCFGASVLLLVLIAVNRYCVITRPRTTCRRFYKNRNLALMISSAYLYTVILFAILPAVGVGMLGYSESYRICAWEEEHPLAEINDYLVALTFGVSFVVIVVCYVRIFLFIRRHHTAMIAHGERGVGAGGESGFDNELTSVDQTETLPSTPSYITASRSCVVNANVNATANSNISAGNKTSGIRKAISRREVEITKNLFYVIVSFFVCIVPYCIALASPEGAQFAIFTGILLMLNACINPIIYSFKHPTFKVVIRCVVCCRFAAVPKPSPLLKKLLQNSRNNVSVGYS